MRSLIEIVHLEFIYKRTIKVRTFHEVYAMAIIGILKDKSKLDAASGGPESKLREKP